jgi:hypothetical protein
MPADPPPTTEYPPMPADPPPTTEYPPMPADPPPTTDYPPMPEDPPPMEYPPMPAEDPPNEGEELINLEIEGEDPSQEAATSAPTNGKKKRGAKDWPKARAVAKSASTHAAKRLDEAAAQHKEIQEKFTSSYSCFEAGPTWLPGAFFNVMAGLAAYALVTGLLVLACWTVVITFESHGRGPAVGVCFAWLVGTFLLASFLFCLDSATAGFALIALGLVELVVVFAVGIAGGRFFYEARILTDNPPIPNTVSHPKQTRRDTWRVSIRATSRDAWHTGPSTSRCSSWRWRRSGRLRVHRRHLRRHQALCVGEGYLQRQQMLPLRCANRPLRCNQSPKFDILLGGRWKHRACSSPPHSVLRAVVCRFSGYNCCYGGVVTCEEWMNGPKAAMYAYPDESVRNDGSTFNKMIQVLPVCVRVWVCACMCVCERARAPARQLRGCYA